MSKTLRRVLVVGPSWVGDMVMAQSLFISLKQNNPTLLIDVLAPDWSLPVLARMPEVNEGIAMPAGHGELKLFKRWRLAKALREREYNQAIVLPRSFKSALIPKLADIPVRTGYKGEMRYGLLNDIRQLDDAFDQTVKRFVALGSSSGAAADKLLCPKPCLKVDKKNQSAAIKRLGLEDDKTVVGIMPGAEYGPAKQWPVRHFAHLVDEITSNGMQAWIFGSAKDESVANEIIQHAHSGGINLCGKTSLRDVVDLIAYTKVAVSNDSGLMHVAAATGVPVIAIYGSSSPGYTPPLSDTAKIMYLDIECSPCFKRQCPYGHYRCLTEITPAAVSKAMHAYVAP